MTVYNSTLVFPNSEHKILKKLAYSTHTMSVMSSYKFCEAEGAGGYEPCSRSITVNLENIALV